MGRPSELSRGRAGQPFPKGAQERSQALRGELETRECSVTRGGDFLLGVRGAPHLTPPGRGDCCLPGGRGVARARQVVGEVESRAGRYHLAEDGGRRLSRRWPLWWSPTCHVPVGW